MPLAAHSRCSHSKPPRIGPPPLAGRQAVRTAQQAYPLQRHFLVCTANVFTPRRRDDTALFLTLHTTGTLVVIANFTAYFLTTLVVGFHSAAAHTVNLGRQFELVLGLTADVNTNLHQLPVPHAFGIHLDLASRQARGNWQQTGPSHQIGATC